MFKYSWRHSIDFILLIVALASLSWLVEPARAQSQSFAKNAPRTIADIVALLDREKPDPKLAERMRADATREPKPGLGRGDLATFYYQRCLARALLGENAAAILDCDKAVQTGRGALDQLYYGRIQQGLAIQYSEAGDLKNALEAFMRMARESDVPGSRGFLFNTNQHISRIYIALGDLKQAEIYVRRSHALLQEMRSSPRFSGYRRAIWQAGVARADAQLSEARGRYQEAEAAYRRAEGFSREAKANVHTYDGLAPSEDQLQQRIDLELARQGVMKARQGRMSEGEADVRRALLSRLKSTGKFNLQANKFIGLLAGLLVEQGRLLEAEQLTRVQIDAYRTLGVAKDSNVNADALAQLATILNLQGRWELAAKIYADLDEAISSWPGPRKELVKSNTDYITTLYSANNYGAGIAAAQRLLERQKLLLGEGHIDTALARGVLAVGLARSGKKEDALDAFKLAIPIIVAASRETDMDDALQTAVRDTRVAFVIEQYMRLLSQHGTDGAVRESFRLGDTIRGRSVQNAVAASSTRATIRDPALADLARRSQDLDKQLVARLGVLNGTLALPSQERDPAVLKSLQEEIQKLRAERDRARRELGQRFRNYANLTDPEAASVDDVQAALHENEAFVSFYFGRDASFAWAVPKTGIPVFHALNITAEEVDAKVRKLREPMEQDDLSPIAPFDVALAHELYAELLRPLETAWRSAKSLVVATNGMLGLLPLGLLPVEAWAGQGGRQSDDFAHYRDVAWLARTHAVIMVPSAASLITLRKLPPGSAQRDAFIGFGDPVFSKEQATESSKVASVDTRGRAVGRRSAVRTTQEESAELARLPRLPDTADELRAVAELLGADPGKSVILGKDANEKRVKATDLAKFRVVAFATHGLLPGDLDGLTQPALALSAPSVADIDGDGLLTMEEVLALKLDADWVLLSACNTATGAGKGAEAVSGLGRSFFYAGTRALLVTNWAVHSASARELVTDIFRQKAAGSTITRAEALRLAMLRLMDGPGYRDEQGKGSFTYAHPLFWAPYSLVGNGGQ